MYREFGFKIEPQVAEGECAHSDAFQECKSRIEFCSKVFVSIGKGGAFYPKPLKRLTSSQMSLNIRARREDAAATKYLTLCINTVRAPLLHAYMKTMLYYWLRKGADINPDLLTEHEKSGLEVDIVEGAASEEVVEWILQECESIQFQMHTLNQWYPLMESYAHETGISMKDQETYILGLESTCVGGGEVTADIVLCRQFEVCLPPLQRCHANGSGWVVIRGTTYWHRVEGWGWTRIML